VRVGLERICAACRIEHQRKWAADSRKKRDAERAEAKRLPERICRDCPTSFVPNTNHMVLCDACRRNHKSKLIKAGNLRASVKRQQLKLASGNTAAQ
jgi:hypothetical protein